MKREFDEPLAESAPLAHRLAGELCGRDPDTGENCAWNHGFWQFLRVLDLVTTPAHHGAFFREAFSAIGEPGTAPRVLISAAADYSMLVQVLNAFGARGIVPRVTVVDVCATPLALNDWYARRAGIRIECIESEILGFRTDERYDLVCSHAFLGQFPPPERPRLIAKWRELLRPDGRAVTVNRIRPGGGAGRTGFTPPQAEAFCETVVRKAESMAHPPLAPAQLQRMAAEYAARQSGYSVTRPGEVTDLFEAGGLRLVHFSRATVTPAAGPATGGPTTPGGVEFACIVAARDG